MRALKQTGRKRIVMAGGVSANRYLRDKFAEESRRKNFDVYYPAFEYCTDNGAMIAYAGCQRLLKGEQVSLDMQAKPRWPLDSLA
jgi:N6-L-threonylcarbamoyladenine synthase